MFIPDLSPHIYHIPTGQPGVLAVGWLDGKHEFPTGDVGARVASEIRRLVKHPVLRFRGYHVCEMCPAPSEWHEAPPQEVVGNGEVWLETPDGAIYSFPTLLPHYIGRHHYLPPPAFVSAVRLGRPLSESECQDRILAHRSRLATDPKPEDILVPYYSVRLMWRRDDFENLTSFQKEVGRVTIVIRQIGLRDFGFYYWEEAYDPSALFHRMRARCQVKHIPAPYGYRYRQTLLSEEEQVLIP